MDTLHAYILILHAKVQRERLQTRIAFLERGQSMNPKLAGLRTALEKLHHNVDVESDKLAAHIESANVTVTDKFKSAHQKLDAQLAPVHAGLAEVSEFLDGLDKLTNGGPSDGSSEKPGEPAASWAGNKPQG